MYGPHGWGKPSLGRESCSGLCTCSPARGCGFARTWGWVCCFPVPLPACQVSGLLRLTPIFSHETQRTGAMFPQELSTGAFFSPSAPVPPKRIQMLFTCIQLCNRLLTMQMYAAFPLHNVLFSFSSFSGNSALPVELQPKSRGAVRSPPSPDPRPGWRWHRLLSAASPSRLLEPSCPGALLVRTIAAHPRASARAGARSPQEGRAVAASARPVQLRVRAPASGERVGRAREQGERDRHFSAVSSRAPGVRASGSS